MSEDIRLLRMMCRGAYDLQALRMQAGLRLCANFRAKLKDLKEAELEEGEELTAEALRIIDELKKSYRRLTDGVAKNRTLPTSEGFHGDELISTHTELTLVDQYVRLEKQERLQFSQMTGTLDLIPIYTDYLEDELGIGPAMAAVLITSFNIYIARHPSQMWAYAGLDVAPDGTARSWRAEHLVDREYTDKDGKKKIRKSTKYNPWLRTKLLGALAPSFFKQGSRWKTVYDNYKHRLETDPKRIKITVTEWKKKFNADEDVSQFWTPGRIHRASTRYAIKMFLVDFWRTWRELEGLPTEGGSYHEGVLGHRHGGPPPRDQGGAETPPTDELPDAAE